ncbi:uncharacterized protein N7500_001983 [Penicillium coprophilum]|uniref:uncharacterized protein n=1 Tax=Penicillium coprophilum TaxID=36646 RepID=UPI00239A0051|nr:uncharacterized protein N7500_001983 [Penicillium coprophilum]KAJ5174052.1 hypothetical protein N7500_001983 [Penicillium coprophilum]
MGLCACKLVQLQRLLRTSRVLRVVVNEAVWSHSRAFRTNAFRRTNPDPGRDCISSTNSQPGSKIADHTTDLLNYTLPKLLHNAGKKFVTALLDKRLRKAMMYPRVLAPC